MTPIQLPKVKSNFNFLSRTTMIPVSPDRFIIPAKVWDILGRNHLSPPKLNPSPQRAEIDIATHSLTQRSGMLPKWLLSFSLGWQ